MLIAKPEIILIARSIITILNVSLKLLYFKRTSNPKPELDNNPLIAVPNVTVPLMSIIVIAIDTAQFGIKPTRAEITGCSNLDELPAKSPPRCMFSRQKFRIKVITRINPKIFNV